MSKEELQYLYWEEENDLIKIGNLFNKAANTVKYWMKKHKIKRRNSKQINTKTTKQFKEEVYKLVKNEYKILDNYENSQTKIKIKHNKCGNVYKVRPNDFLIGKRCPKCANYWPDKKTTNEFKKEVKKIVGEEYKVIGEYKGANKKIKIKHNKCGHIYGVKPSKFLHRTRCPFCARNYEKTTKQFKKEVKKLVNDEYKILGEYKKSKAKIKIKHNKCGHIYKTTPTNFLFGYRCPNCNFSKGENEIKNVLKSKGIKNKPQATLDGCKNKKHLRFDFKIKNKAIVIEYNGRQHYEPVEYFGGKEQFKYQQKNDQIKKDYCQANNIKLITIPYWEKDNIEEILEKELMLD